VSRTRIIVIDGRDLPLINSVYLTGRNISVMSSTKIEAMFIGG
jgi:hypothetical protein